jgi:hypothetical protein
MNKELRDFICARVDAAEAEIDRGEFREYDETNLSELTRDVHERGMARLARVAEGGRPRPRRTPGSGPVRQAKKQADEGVGRGPGGPPSKQ